MATFAQLSARLKNFLGGWLLVLGIKEGLVECATVCVKNVVILTNLALEANVVMTISVNKFPRELQNFGNKSI